MVRGAASNLPGSCLVARPLLWNLRRYLASRASSLLAGFLSGEAAPESSAAAGGAVPISQVSGGDAALRMARQELDETKKEAAATLQFHKALIERLEGELAAAKKAGGKAAKAAPSAVESSPKGPPPAKTPGSDKKPGAKKGGKKKPTPDKSQQSSA